MSLLGSLITAGVGLYTANKAEKRADKAAKADRANTVRDREEMFTDLRAAAEKGGFNPLTALAATGGQGFGSGSSSSGVSGSPAPLASVQAITSGLTGVGEALTSQQAKNETVTQANQDIAEAQVQKQATDVIPQSTINSSGPSLRRRPVPVDNVDIAPARMDQVTPSMPEEPVANIAPTVGHVREDYVTTSGETVSVPVGPDLDEIVAGFGIEATGYYKRLRPTRLGISREINRELSKNALDNRQSYPVDPYRAPRRGNTWNKETY